MVRVIGYEGDPGFRSKIEQMKIRQKADREALAAAFAQSPAIIVEHPRRSSPYLYVLSGDMRRGHGLRVSAFDDRGPFTHYEGATVDELVGELARSGVLAVRPATEDEVIAWTSTEDFERGSQKAAFVHVFNMFRSLVAQLPQEMRADADAFFEGVYTVALEHIERLGMEAATATMVRGYDELRTEAARAL